MTKAADIAIGPHSDAHWKSLGYFNFYRFCVAGLLFLSSLLQPLSMIWRQYYRRRFNMQLSLNVLVDIVVLALFMHTGSGLRSDLGTMLLVMLAGAGLVGQGRLVLFYAALATIVARLLARRVIANEELARKRGVELRNQILISQRVIEEMQEGVLVISRAGIVKLHNPRVEQLLGLGDPTGCLLVDYSTELARGFADWCEFVSDAPMVVRAPASGMQLRARFVSTDSSERDVLVFLEDAGRLQEQARQLKLAALGRLTANIAHEIRNPLPAN